MLSPEIFGIRSAKHRTPSPGNVSFSIRPAPWDSQRLLVHPAGYPIESPPVLSLVASKQANPNVVLSRGWGGGPFDVIGTAELPSMFGFTSHLTLRGEPLNMRMSQMSGSFSLDHKCMGPVKWKTDGISGKTLELRDRSGTRLAKFGSRGHSGEKYIEMVAGDECFVELVLLSGMTARAVNKTISEATAEVMSPVVGA
ncbi:hypothetical protein N7492_002685 [Penicillium capsulatum]|uniref:Uncharacterized protein n=1 Tax=Penicillium capsulatum TaxID=69766 RepID=A0A9W9IM20_9EURO|nr:hypothetical protein N7492_002685 [Penicillium capsulatum]KAJ6122717.1 hypothetical protein N7512_005182 [Penicillium capsulatum]